jgi:hypothetical protein
MPDETIPLDEQFIADNPDQTAAAVTPETPDPPYEINSGETVPPVAIETSTVELSVNTARIHNFAITEFLAVPDADTSELAGVKRDLLGQLMIDNDVDTILSRMEKQLNLFFLKGLDDESLAKVYGVPIEEYGEKVRFKPQITIKFRELEINKDDTPVRINKLLKQISFRLLGDNIPNTRQELATLREKILDTFGSVSFLVSKDETYTYRDLSNGYRMAIDANREIAVDLFTKALDIQGFSFDGQYFAKGEVNRPEIPPTAIVFGETVNLPFRGRWGTVYFWKAEYKQAGIADKILAVGYPLEIQ